MFWCPICAPLLCTFSGTFNPCLALFCTINLLSSISLHSKPCTLDKCFLRLCFLVNPFWHKGQTWGFSPVCWNMCCWRWTRLGHTWPQRGHVFFLAGGAGASNEHGRSADGKSKSYKLSFGSSWTGGLWFWYCNNKGQSLISSSWNILTIKTSRRTWQIYEIAILMHSN